MDARRETILKAIVDEYIRTAEPVGSKTLVERYALDVSSATVRNEMAALEEEGYIAQPHTSAGRIPTEQAFVYYLQHFVQPTPTPDASRMRAATRRVQDDEQVVRVLTRTLSELTGEMAIAAFDPRASFYAGVSNLLSKPDFGDLEVVKALSQLIDRFDEVVEEVFDHVPNTAQVMIGRQNPFGNDMSTILVKYRLPSGHIGILGLVGPMRMDYGRNIALLQRAKELLDEEDDC